MPKRLRMMLSLLAVVGLSAALAACGDDDDDASTATTEAEAADADDGDEGADDGAPDVNPCAEGESGTFGEPGPAPAADATPIDLTATDYSFAGADALGTQGSYAMTLTNEGQELHEAVIVRLAEGETRPLEELLAGDEEPETTDVAFTFACPGASAAPTAVEIDEPGRYVLLCFIPVGTLPTTAPEDFPEGPPHAAQGMVQEFTVS